MKKETNRMYAEHGEVVNHVAYCYKHNRYYDDDGHCDCCMKSKNQRTWWFQKRGYHIYWRDLNKFKPYVLEHFCTNEFKNSMEIKEQLWAIREGLA